ncbi:TIGR02757 family protein [Cyclonatronum proteinivorum]|uniref:TIGR02757 family protein n=1 Tax=Cyclonatronum proteinivorum TaxID=1457365 RepID=A0A345ULS1_9BACT|nr:TIGR02757 family protein [Cyclonatronum proteinivorum]AXJ01423.1 TIGR02757 family protein [Cyclonatronum proteinivorum]
MPKASRHRTIALKRIPDLKPFLDEIITRVEVPAYIDKDPVLFLHAYDDVTDKQLAGFFAAIMAWGRRDVVIAKVSELMERMGHRPAVFIGSYTEADRDALAGFKHRTFTEEDVHHLVLILNRILHEYGDFEAFWKSVRQQALTQQRELIATFHERFMAYHTGPQRTRKHIASSEKGSSCKRLYLYLRWTVRKNSIVDTGIYTFMPASELMIPLDVHVARHARRLGLLGRKQNDWAAVQELTKKLRLLRPDDPAVYDYALFGLGIADITVPEEIIINKRIP